MQVLKYQCYFFIFISTIIVSCATFNQQATYYPSSQAYPASNTAAEWTELPDTRLSSLGYHRIGSLKRTWSPEKERMSRLPEFQHEPEKDLPTPGLFDKSFLDAISDQAGKVGGDLVRREKDRVFYKWDTLSIIRGNKKIETTMEFKFEELEFSVWREIE